MSTSEVNLTNSEDISFCDTDTEELANYLITGYELITQRTLYPADPTRLFILWVADIISQERVIIDQSAKMNLPRFAKGEFLDCLAEIFYFGIPRLEAEKATTILRFYLSTELEEEYTVNYLIEVTIDGEINFKTKDKLVFPAGAVYIDVEAECTEAGVLGNDFVPGQISKIVDEQFQYFKGVENITISSGGTEKESDTDYYNRMRDGFSLYSTAGSERSYEYHTKSVSSLIEDVRVETEAPGEVTVSALLRDGEIPTESLNKKIKIALSADEVRPLTDKVNVISPEVIPYNIDFVYYIKSGFQESNKKIVEGIDEAIKEYAKWQQDKLGRDINPKYLDYLVMKHTFEKGLKRIDILQPELKEISDRSIAKLDTNNINIVFGGYENE